MSESSYNNTPNSFEGPEPPIRMDQIPAQSTAPMPQTMRFEDQRPPQPDNGYVLAQQTPAAQGRHAAGQGQWNGDQQYAAERQYAPQPANANPAPQKKSNGGKTFLFGFLGALVACVLALGGFMLWQGSNKQETSSPKESASISQEDSASGIALGNQDPSNVEEGTTNLTLPEAVAAKATPSVGCIYVYAAQHGYNGYFGAAQNGDSSSMTQTSLGSGIVLTEDGYMLTNYHVIEGADALKVNIEGTEYDAQIVGTDPSSDLAVIKMDNATGLTAADIGDSDNLTVGEWVMTVGSPFGLESSVATGVVSAVSRSSIMDNSQNYYYGFGAASTEPTLYPNMIQTDAAINPGNSGGALVDSDGKVIGVNTLITSYSGNYSGVGFAIPINYAINIADQIIAGKTPTHAKLGVSLATVNSSNAKRYNLATESGAYVTEVVADSGADAAGIKAGDIVTAFDGEPVTNSTDLTLDIREHNPGDTVTITVNRNGEVLDLTATLGSDEADLAAQQLQDEQLGQQLEQDPNGELGGGLTYEDILRFLENM